MNTDTDTQNRTLFSSAAFYTFIKSGVNGCIQRHKLIIVCFCRLPNKIIIPEYAKRKWKKYGLTFITSKQDTSSEVSGSAAMKSWPKIMNSLEPRPLVQFGLVFTIVQLVQEASILAR